MQFTYDLTTDIGQVRLLIGDSTRGAGLLPNNENFWDDEIGLMLERNDDNVDAASVELLEIASRKWSTMVDTTMGPLKESYSQAAGALLSAATALRANVPALGVSGVQTSAVPFVRNDGYAIAAEEEMSE